MNQAALRRAALGGDESAFVALTSPHRRELHVHLYRMLGSLDDDADALQETLLRAWRGLAGFEPRAPLRAWLYRIATNVALRAIERRGRQPAETVERHLQPYPDRLLEQLPAPDPTPAAEIEARESVGLAFVAAMQLLPPLQRAVLVLRDVLAWSAREVADALGTSVAAVNSALQRARARLARERAEGTLGRRHLPESGTREAEIMRRFQAAWAAVDLDGIVALLAEDVLLTMPPEDARVHGREAVGAFFATQPLDGRLDRIRLEPARANGQPVLAAYADEAGDGTFTPYGAMVFAIDGDRIVAIAGFPRQPELFAALGLPAVTGGDP